MTGKVLLESGAKVAFDGDPKKYTAFRQGMERIISMYGGQNALMFDVLQSRCVGKAAEAIKNCDRIREPKLALEAALSKLERYYGNDSSVTEAHIAHITRPEPIRWSVEAFQTLVNELEDIQSLFKIDDRIGILNSPGILKGVITRLPKRTKEKLTERLSASNVHMPSFEYLLAFVNEQLDLVSHPLSHLDACNKQSSKVESSQRVNRESKFRNKCDKYNVKAYSQNVSVSSCPVVGCLNKESHALCKCGKFAELNKRDRWAITK